MPSLVKMLYPKVHLVFFSIFLSWLPTPGLATTAQTSQVLSLTKVPGSHIESRAPHTSSRHLSMKRRHVGFTHHPHFHHNISARADSGVPTYKTCSVPQSFALTVDDGPTELSEELDKKLEASPGSKISYFINGNNNGCIYDYADILIRRHKQGHLIASHTWSHVHLKQGNYQQIARQIDLLDEALIKILGVKPLYFRPPYGEYNDVVLQVLHDKGYKGMILWSGDSDDSSSPAPSTSEVIQKHLSLPEKTIMLNHETRPFITDEVLTSVFQDLKSKSFKLMTATECLELGSNPSDWYKFVQEPGTRDNQWTCDGTPGPGQYE